MDLFVTPEVVTQIIRALPQVSKVATQMGLPITARVEEQTDVLVPRQVLRLEVGERDEYGHISGISLPIITRLYEEATGS